MFIFVIFKFKLLKPVQMRTFQNYNSNILIVTLNRYIDKKKYHHISIFKGICVRHGGGHTAVARSLSHAWCSLGNSNDRRRDRHSVRF